MRDPGTRCAHLGLLAVGLLCLGLMVLPTSFSGAPSSSAVPPALPRSTPVLAYAAGTEAARSPAPLTGSALPGPSSDVPRGPEAPRAPCNASWPSSLTSGSFNVSTDCSLIENYTIGAGATLEIWSPETVVVNPTTGNRSLTLLVQGTLLLQGGQDFSVNGTGKVSLRLVLLGTLELQGGGELDLSNISSLLVGPSASILDEGGALTAPSPATVTGAGGALFVTDGGSVYGGPSLPPGTPPPAGISHLTLLGTFAVLNDSGGPLAWTNVSEVTDLLANEVPVDHVNVNSTSIDLQGFVSRPEPVSDLNVPSAESFRADDADLAQVALTSVVSVTLGAPLATSDVVNVTGFTVAKPFQNLTIAHAYVTSFGIDSVEHVDVINSTFLGGDTVTQATRNFSANGSSRFAFALTFNNGPWVNLTNVTAPGLVVAGLANVTVYNWPFATSYTGGATGTLSSIIVEPEAVSVHVWRYVLVSVSSSTGSKPAPDTSVRWCNQVLAGHPCASSPVGSLGSVGQFVETDVVTLLGVDAFVGTYTVTASSSNGASASTTLSVLRDDVQVNLTTTVPVVPPQLVPYLLVELGAVGVVVGLIVYLRARITRVRRPRAIRSASSKGTDEAPTVEGAPGPEPTSATPAGASPHPRLDEWKPPSP